MPYHILEVVMSNKELCEFQGLLDLDFRISMPPAGLVVQLVLGQDNFVFRIQCPEPGLIFVAHLFQRARIVHLDPNGIAVQSAQPIPVAPAPHQAQYLLHLSRRRRHPFSWRFYQRPSGGQCATRKRRRRLCSQRDL